MVLECFEYLDVTEDVQGTADPDDRPGSYNEIVIGEQREQVPRRLFLFDGIRELQLLVEDVDDVTHEVVNILWPDLRVEHGANVDSGHSSDQRDDALGHRAQHTFFGLERGEQHDLGETGS